ncbi:hypothetical protein KC343_g11940 [Hortaea werneckii]|uniref:Fungal lipase-type domain-containing protein n=1 Tax=Hortaea werneckii TaxID=91943 RepID=A0A3M7ERK9_HORWE|nr:hypothetical protein KC346_g11720 [Hortaea werneckii]KAI7610428.1 hypothetical protein KC343_g11940 [Hortaea werneckii]KAI7653998.1 hypothetical protein KC319_g10372 [Hortaea werneckii]KAI7689592.1 hypothetical protein KC322_g11754 [Hortaea werneckii]RMY79057.1 hypothetical protein D0864_09157 [Hortaea werneckii]
MQLFTSRKDGSGRPAEPARSSRPKRRAHSAAPTNRYAYDGPKSSSAPSVPPLPPCYKPAPPYQNGYLKPPPVNGGPVQPYRPAKDARYGSYDSQLPAWASTSTLDLGGPGGYMQLDRREDRPLPPPRPEAGGNDDCPLARRMNQGAAFFDGVAANLMDFISKADGDMPAQAELERSMRGLKVEERSQDHIRSRSMGNLRAKEETSGKDAAAKSAGHFINFEKSWMYQNSRLPPVMLPFKVYLPTWTLACRAAQASVDVYKRPSRDRREHYTAADPKQGTKATIMKSEHVDDRKLIIIAIRGSKWNLMDWTVNFAISPTEPVGFLDDPGNACHAGFLEVARAMVPQISTHLRRMIEEDPSWGTSSVLFTGHSAGGAVASLLYAHMLSRTVESELNVMAGFFRRVHCVTFGAPPVALLPLQVSQEQQHRRSQFLAFINEGDVVVRADRTYLSSLIRLLAAPTPSRNDRARLRGKAPPHQTKGTRLQPTSSAAPQWDVPEATLSNAGRLVLLREKPNSARNVPEAVCVSEEQLRDVVFGDPAMHPMVLYKRRIDDLAFAAVSGHDAG